MAERGNSIFSKKINGGNKRNYFIDIKQSERTGNKYLLLVEARIIEGNWNTQRIAIFPEYLHEWKEGLIEALQHLEA